MIDLPIDAVLPDVLQALRAASALVLVAPPGAGKTTRVPPAVLGLLNTEHPNVVVLQPRRVAARAAAARIAQEQGWELGGQAGYHIRFERRLTDATRVRVLTEGILTRQLLDDPYLDRIGCVILDEFHERNINTDMAIAMLREVQQTVRPDLKLVVMSATLEAAPVAEFLGGCPVLHSRGRLFDVALTYAGAPPAQRGVGQGDAMQDRIAGVVDGLLAGPDAVEAGDILIFLPGAEEIRRTMQRLETVAHREDALLVPLHGSLPAPEQFRALEPATRRKIICATNIAETSLTIEGVRTVIDSGLARVAGYDPRRGLDKLELKRISLASARQRAGRAGRTAPGRCIRMWSAADERHMAEFDLPEILRVDLCPTVLAVHAWGQADPRAFGWLTPPPAEMLAAAEKLLAMLGALSAPKGGTLTPMGKRLLGLPVHPRIGRMLIAAADQGMLEQGATLAALLSERDILVHTGRAADGGGAFGKNPRATVSRSDLLVRMALLDEAARGQFHAALRDRGIDLVAARQVMKTRDELLRVGRTIGSSTPHPRAANAEAQEDALLKLALVAYPDRVVRRREADPAAGIMVGGTGVRLAPESSVHQSDFYLAIDARQDERSRTREALVRIASSIDPQWLEELFPTQMRHERGVEFDESTERIVPVTRLWYRDLLLKEDRHGQLDPDKAAEVLAAAIRPRAPAIFADDERAATWLARLDLLRTDMPENPWPIADDAALGELLASVAAGKRSLADFAKVNLTELLDSLLHYPLDRKFAELAPESITVPTGNSIRVAYVKGQPPVLAVRLQELFGMTDTPRIAGGRVAVLLHLLSPGYKPVQITHDLRSFWKSAYFEVRKDLRVRYPKHAWPEDPLTAAPVSKGRPRR